MFTQKWEMYRGYSIEREIDRSYSVYKLGYMANFKTITECKAYIDSKF